MCDNLQFHCAEHALANDSEFTLKLSLFDGFPKLWVYNYLIILLSNMQVHSLK